MNVHLAKFIMYHEIHRMAREGHSARKISKYLVLSKGTVLKYLSMTEQDYENFLIAQSDKKKLLLPYESFIKQRLEVFSDTSAAQMHDWLKEHYPEFPKVSQKTVFNFVHRVREKYNIPLIKQQRQYHPVEELPYGKQAQVDFGEYNMRTTCGKRVKVCFFTLVLSRSRYKFVWFADTYFTAELAVKAHELAFEYIRGIPDEVAYDQDSVFVVSENAGDLILTDVFRAYTREQPFNLHFCRKSDPESKGKVENVVKYVKQNFLYNRTFYNIETLNDDALGWLGRTANALPHAFTQKDPVTEWHIEQAFLKPYHPYTTTAPSILRSYTVRKDNSISYKGNLYSLPLGTYKGHGSVVSVHLSNEELLIFDENQQELCRHKLSLGRGQKIINTDHRRDKTTAIADLTQEVANLFQCPADALKWLKTIKQDKPRYIRDQLLLLKDIVQQTPAELCIKVLQYCLDNQISSAVDFKAIADHYQKSKTPEANIVHLNPLNGILSEDAYRQPDKSSIEDYQNLLKNK
jgi:transposase